MAHEEIATIRMADLLFVPAEELRYGDIIMMGGSCVRQVTSAPEQATADAVTVRARGVGVSVAAGFNYSFPMGKGVLTLRPL